MKELYVGAKLNMNDLADWFGVKPQTLRKTKEKKLTRLKEYADFNIIETGAKHKYTVVEITEVYCPVYTKAIEIIKEKRDQYRDPMHTGVDRDNLVSARMYKNEPLIQKTVKEDTCYSYCTKVSRERYGKIYDDKSRGSQGYRYPVWAKKEYDPEIGVYYRQLTQEEYQKIQEAKIEAKLFTDDKMSIMMREFNKKYDDSGRILTKAGAKEAEEDFQQLIWSIKAQNWALFDQKCYEKLGFIPDSAIKEVKYKGEITITPININNK